MTAISPLQSIHKKGSFGDHHQKNEHDLINISDIIILINMILNDEYLQQGDLNVDGMINIADIVLLVNIILQ